MGERFVLLKPRTLRLGDVRSAVEVHASMWNDPQLVANPAIVNAQVLHNQRFQKGLWVYDSASRKKQLVAAVNTARFRLGNINPASLRVEEGETIPTDYGKAALSVEKNGNALGCFIITRASDGFLERRFGGDADKVKRLLRGAAEKLVRAVKAEARKAKIDYLTAVSTPVEIEKTFNLQPGTPATFDQAVDYVKTHDCPVLKRFHGRLGAEVLKLIARPDGFNARPLSQRLGGGGVIALMLYPFGKGKLVLRKRPESLPSTRK